MNDPEAAMQTNDLDEVAHANLSVGDVKTEQSCPRRF